MRACARRFVLLAAGPIVLVAASASCVDALRPDPAKAAVSAAGKALREGNRAALMAHVDLRRVSNAYAVELRDITVEANPVNRIGAKIFGTETIDKEIGSGTWRFINQVLNRTLTERPPISADSVFRLLVAHPGRFVAFGSSRTDGDRAVVEATFELDASAGWPAERITQPIVLEKRGQGWVIVGFPGIVARFVSLSEERAVPLR